MISTAYLHEHDILDSFMEETHHIMNDVYDAMNRLTAAENYIDEQVFMGESVEDYQVMLEDTKKNVFAIIGDKIIEFFKAASDALIKFGKNIASSLKIFKKHANDEALKEQMKNNPELAKKFIDSVMSGNIKMHDVKDMNDLLKTAQELTDQLMNGKIDETEYMDKVDKKLDKYANRAKNITAILGVIAGTTGVLTVVSKLNLKGKEVDAEAIRIRGDFNALKETAMREANRDAGGKTNRVAVWLKGQKKIATALETDYSGWRSVLANGADKLGDLVGKINTGYNRKDKAGPIERKRARDVDSRNKRIQDEDDKQRVLDQWAQVRETRADSRKQRDDANANDRAYNQAFYQRSGQLAAEDHDAENNSDRRFTRIYNDSRANSAGYMHGNVDFEQQNRGAVSEYNRRSAYNSEMGRSDARRRNQKRNKNNGQNNP